MDGIQVVPAFEVIGHLLQAILVRIEHDHFGIGRQTRNQLIGLADLPIDEHDFLALGPWLSTRCLSGGRGLTVLVAGGAVIGRVDGCLRGRILGYGTDRRIEHDSRFKSHQQRSLARFSGLALLGGLAQESLDEFHVHLLVNCRAGVAPKQRKNWRYPWAPPFVAVSCASGTRPASQ